MALYYLCVLPATHTPLCFDSFLIMTDLSYLHRLLLLLVACSMFLGTKSLQAQTTAAPETLYVELTSAIIKAVEVSPEVGSVVAQQDFATARLGLAKASRFLTEFNATTAHSLAPGLKGTGDSPTTELYLNPDVANDWDNLSPFNRIEAEAIQPLFTWGELSNNIKAADYGVRLEQASVTEKEAEIALRTGQLFMDYLLTEELLRLTDRTGDVLEQAKEEIERLLEEGASDVDDADLFQVQISEQEFYRRVVEVTQQREIARVALTRQLNLPDGVFLMAQNSISLKPLYVFAGFPGQHISHWHSNIGLSWLRPEPGWRLRRLSWTSQGQTITPNYSPDSALISPTLPAVSGNLLPTLGTPSAADHYN